MSKNCKCLTKAKLAEIIQSGQADPGGPAPQTFNGSLQGTILSDGGNFNGVNLFGNNQWDQAAHPASNFSIGPLINPACGGPNGSAQIGTIVINPNLPAGLTADSFDLTIEILDNSAGLGGMFLFCVTDLQTFGPIQSGFNTTTTWDISNAPCPPEDIRVGMSAFGATSSYPVENCDEINPVPETIVIITPSKCIAAAACAEQLFGCSISEMQAAEEDSPLTALEDKVASLQIPIYRLSESPNGYKIKAWFGEDAAAMPAGLITPELVDEYLDTVFDVSSGQPVHVNGDPTQEIIYDTSSNFNDSAAFGGAGGPGNGLDQYVIETYLDTRGQGVVDLRDVNGNSGEAARVYVSTCCGPLLPVGHITDIAPFNAGTFATALPEGIHCIMVLESDRTAFGGFQPQWAPTGTDEFATIPVASLWTEKRELECQYIPACDAIDTLPEGWVLEEPKLCTPKPAISGGSSAPEATPHLELSTVLPVGDQSGNDLISTIAPGTHRRGSAGTLETASKCDHRHPILRINPTPLRPELTFAGAGTLENIARIGTDRSTEEWVQFHWRALVGQDAGNGWGYLQVPNIGGFQRPEIDVIGTYRVSGNPQFDETNGNPNGGAAPAPAYMGQEAHHWSGSQRVYMGFNRRDNAHRTYVEIKARYICL